MILLSHNKIITT